MITPYTLANALNIRISLAKRLLKKLAAENVVSVIAKSRSLIVAVPKNKK